MQTTFKVPFAYDDQGRIVDQHTAEKQKDYKCQCGATVRLRGGDKVSNHFYHEADSKCSLESAIHKAYKDLFKQVKKVRLPYPINGKDVLEFDRVELEVHLVDFVPDAIGYIGDKMFLIEFAKTSFVGERKLQKIQEQNLFCLEVSIMKQVKSIDGIVNHLVNGILHKDVLHIPGYKPYIEAIKTIEEMKNDLAIKEMIIQRNENEYNDLRNKHNTLLRLNETLYTNLESLKNIISRAKDLPTLSIYNAINNSRLNWKMTCKNGSQMYVSENGALLPLVAFVTSQNVFLKVSDR